MSNSTNKKEAPFISDLNDSKPVAKMAVSAAKYHIDKPYNYLIPQDLATMAFPGMRAIVPFGNANRKVEAIILSLGRSADYEKLKYIDSFLDDEPVFNGESLKLAIWMSDRFFCTAFEALKVMMPSYILKSLKRQQSLSDGEVEPITIVNTDISNFENAGDELVLNNEQSKVFEKLAALLESETPEAALLYGVTGSGKTAVYIKLIERAIGLGKSAIVLVPEIALTKQTVDAFKSYFGDVVAVIHSALRTKKRFEEFLRIRTGEARVVIGTRSAIFSPLENIGLIIIDEEQEHTYKSENIPRYHARDIGKYRAAHSGALLLVSSATPTIESMYAAKIGNYKLFRIEKRFNLKALPPVIIADMKKELKDGNNSSISSVLQRELEYNFKHGEQSILFVNRRGASPLVACGECGYTFRCNRCSVSMTYHSVPDKLLCHYCGFSQHLPSSCPECSGALKLTGAGTQKVESELKSLFSGVSIIRMDADAVTRVNSHDKLLSRFRETKAQILLGTHMITKGLDFENVTLVGVISADSSLYLSDFRAHERTFSMLTQVIGRSGRGEKPGRAVIQTFTPEHEVLRFASNQDYDGFYEREICMRESLSCPPICDLIVITAVGLDEKAVVSGCTWIRQFLEGYFNLDKSVRLLGPAPVPVIKVKNKFRYRLLVSCKNTRKIRDTVAHGIKEFKRNKLSKGVTVFAEQD